MASLKSLPFFFFVFLFLSSIATANNPLASTQSKLIQLANQLKTQGNSNNEEGTTSPPINNDPATGSPLEVGTSTGGVSEGISYLRIVLTLRKARAERLSTPNAAGNMRKKLRLIIAAAVGRPAEGLNVTMTIEPFVGANPNALNPKVLLIVLVGIPSNENDPSLNSAVAQGNNASSSFATQLLEETGAESISVSSYFNEPPPSSDGLPFTSSDATIFEAYKTIILAIAISIIGIVFLGAVILFLTKTKERRERLLELLSFGGRLRREANRSSSTFDHKHSRRTDIPKRSSGRTSGRNTNGKPATSSGRTSTVKNQV